MATFTAEAAGNWTSNVVWGKDAGSVEGFNYPGPNDDVVLDGFAVTANIIRIPSTGTLTSLTSVGTAGQLSVDMASLASFTLYCTTITAGTKPTNSGIVYIYGTGTGKTVTIVATTITGGSNNGAHAIYVFSAGSIFSATATTIQGGSSAIAHGISNASSGSATSIITATNITGNGNGHGYYQGQNMTSTITGTVSTTGTYGGVNMVSGGPSCTFVGNILCENGFWAWNSGYPGTWTANPTTQYIKIGTPRYAQEVAAANIKKDIANGTVTGTYAFNVNGISVSGPA